MGHVPNTQRAPLPPFQFKSLTNVFRSALFPNEAFPEPVTSKAKSPRKQTRKTTRNSVSIEGVHTVSPTKRNSQTYEPTVSFSTAEPFGQEVSSTMKGAKGKRAPRSTSLKGSKSNDPTKQQIIALCTGMKVHNAVTPAILKSYRIYNNLVKDKWGLLCGIVVIVASKAQPRLIEGNSQAFYTRLKNMTNVDQDRLDEWIRWAASIINDQSWIKKVTDPNAKGITFKKEYKKYSSGIGNMVRLKSLLVSFVLFHPTDTFSRFQEPCRSQARRE